MPRVIPLAVTVLLAATTWAADAPMAKVAIVEPAASQELTGNVSIRVKADVPEGATAPSVVYAGLGGAPWTELKRNDAGEWTGGMDTTLVPNGSCKLIVLTENKRVGLSIDVSVNNPLRVYFADLHSHTSYSDGTLVPAAAHAYARDVAKLDVFCLTDHLESVSDDEWLDIRETAWDANEDGRFVAIPGLEWTKKWGHLNIYDPNTRVWPADPQEFYAAAAKAGVVTKFNHPGDGTQSHDGLAYSEAGDKTVQLMEVRGAAEEKAFIRALDAGWHIAPEGSSDTHSANWGNVRTWTGLLSGRRRQSCGARTRRQCRRASAKTTDQTRQSGQRRDNQCEHFRSTEQGHGCELETACHVTSAAGKFIRSP